MFVFNKITFYALGVWNSVTSIHFHKCLSCNTRKSLHFMKDEYTCYSCSKKQTGSFVPSEDARKTSEALRSIKPVCEASWKHESAPIQKPTVVVVPPKLFDSRPGFSKKARPK